MRVLAVVVALAVSVVGVLVFVRGVRAIVGVVSLGGPARRSDSPGRRWRTMLTETLGHTRMLQRPLVGIAHWCVFVAFGALFFTLITAYGQLFDPRFVLPVIGHWRAYAWLSEVIAWAGLVAILYLIGVRLTQRGRGRASRFFGSHGGKGLYVELTILGIVVCVLLLRALESQLLAGETTRWDFPLTWFLLPAGIATPTAETAVVLLAALKIVISMAWFVVLGRDTTMGVAWHRFTVWPNVWFKRNADGAPALGALLPVRAGGEPVDFDDLDALDEDASLGTGTHRGLHLEGPARPHLAAPSAAAARTPARRGRPTSRSRPSSSSWACATTRTPRPPGCRRPRPSGTRSPEALRLEAARPLVGPTGHAGAQRRGEPDPIACRTGPSPSSTPTPCGRAPPAAPASRPARWTSSTSTTSSTCAATRC